MFFILFAAFNIDRLLNIEKYKIKKIMLSI